MQMTHLAPNSDRPPRAGRRPQASAAADHWGPLFVTLVLACWAATFGIGFKAGLGILTACGFIAAIVGLFRPVIGLFGVGILCTLDPLMNSFLFTGGLWRWNTFNYLLALVAVMSAPLLLGMSDARNRLAQLFATLLGLELLASPDWYTGLQDVAGVAALFGLVVYFARAAEDVAAWRWLALVCGATAAAGGIAYFLQQTTLPYLNRNASAFLPLTALFAISLAFPLARPGLRGQGILAILAAANYTLVFLSGSRGTLLTATGCGLVILILTQRMRRRWVVVLTAGLVVLAMTRQFNARQSGAVNRINLLLNPQQSLLNRTSGRSALLIDGWHMFLDHPLGVGTGGYGVTRVNSAGAGPRWEPSSQLAAHAGWIKILAENGLPGIALIGPFVLSFAVAGWRSRNRDLLMLGLLVTLAFGLGFVSTEYQNKGLWFLAAGVMVLLRPGSVLTRRARGSA